MSKSSKPFEKYRYNNFSQNGEDGVIEEILVRLAIDDQVGWCVEFGAWDGIHLSNTFSLVKDKDWSAVYIEGDGERFEDLLVTAKNYKNINAIKAYVSHQKEHQLSLDNLLRKTKIPINFDLLSVDIDSFDLDVWESLENYKPKIVVIEINSSFLPGIFFRNSHKISGNSFSSTLSVGVDKGYTLVAHTGNMIFIRNDLLDLVGFSTRFIQHPELLFDYNWIAKQKDNIFKKIKKKSIFLIKRIKKK
jgi:hypothetical protein